MELESMAIVCLKRRRKVRGGNHIDRNFFSDAF